MNDEDEEAEKEKDLSTQIEITKDTATPAVARLAAMLSPQRLAAAYGPACARLVERNFVSLGTNKRGWPSTGFWAEAARATSWKPDPEGARVLVTKLGVRQRLKGGTIEPVKAKMIAYPVDAESYGKLPSEFPDLFVVKTVKGLYLARREGKGKTAKFKFLFRLKASVDQKANPEVLPSKEEFGATARAAILEAIRN